MDIKPKIREAEVYHSMGLLDESLGIYEEILSGISEFDPYEIEDIKERANLLKEEIENHKKARGQYEADIRIMKAEISDWKKQLGITKPRPKIKEEVLEVLGRSTMDEVHVMKHVLETENGATQRGVRQVLGRLVSEKLISYDEETKDYSLTTSKNSN